MEELQRQYRIIDMLLTMYSILRDRYRILATLLDLIILGNSAIICAFVFVDSSLIQWLGISGQKARVVIGLFSVLVFLLSLVSIITNWSGKAEKYSQAAEVLSRLKGECRDFLNENEDLSEAAKQWITVSRINLNTLPVKVPEKEFNKLKAKHLRKIEISKLISKYPGCPVLILNIDLFFKSIHKLAKMGGFKSGSKESNPV